MIYVESKSWDIENSKFIDDDIKEEIKDVPMHYHDIIMLQLVKELKKLNKGKKK